MDEQQLKADTTPAMAERGFVFWCLCPFLLLFLLLMPLLIELNSIPAMLALVGIEVLVGLLFLALLSPTRFWWAGRIVGALIFAGYSIYLIGAIGIQLDVIPRSCPATAVLSSLNALAGLTVFGIPGLCYALYGRFTFREKNTPDSDFVDDQDFDLDDDSSGSP